MDKSKADIWVYAHWLGMKEPKCIGMLSAHFGKWRKSFSFEYDKDWLSSQEQLLLDPDLGWYSGPQFLVIINSLRLIWHLMALLFSLNADA